MINAIEKAINGGIKFLAREQLPNGSFWCLVSTKLDDYSKAKLVPAIVPTNFVLSSLIHIKSAEAESIKRKVANFLLKEKGKYWSFNYWFRKSDWYKKEPYPDDTDDTFVPLAALYEYKPELFDGEVMAKITTMLTSAEKDEAGPYDMWLVPPEARDKWNDTDLVCNANIAYFLSLQDIYLPKVNKFIERKIISNGYEFPYNRIYPAVYFISRSYKGAKVINMINLLIKNQEKDGKWENPLRTALAISALINFSGDKYKSRLQKGIRYLLKTQKSDGSWKPYSFYFQMRKKEKMLYAGSSSITSALCLEAINKYSKSPDFAKASPGKQISNSQKQIYTRIVKMVKERFSAAGKELKKEAERVISKTLKGDKDAQVVLLPYFFRNSFKESNQKISDDVVIQLGAANMFGWMAYTIYDDFLDLEGEPKLLSIANVCLRESAEIFGSALPTHTGFAAFAKNIFDTIDNANIWEVGRCWDVSLVPNYGNYVQLADKSIGHALGPMAILFALGYKEHSTEARRVMSFFKNYIIARQLNDDAHDWEDDLKRGQINAVGARLLRDAKGGNKSPEKLREIFWRKTIISACKDISRHIKLAKSDLKKLSIIQDPAVFAEMLATIERSVEKALKEREETIKFLKTYTK